MAKYRQLIAQDGTEWCLMSPSNPFEALRIAWMLWRHPDRVAALVGVKQEYTLRPSVRDKRPDTSAQE